MKTLFNHIYKQIKDINFQENELCRQYWLKLERLNADFSDEKALEMLTENIEWLVNSKVISSEVVLKLGNESKMKEAGIYFSGTVVDKDIKVILFGDAKAVISGHSRAVCFDNSICECYDSSFVTGFHNSTITGKNSKIVVFDNAKIKSKGLCLIEDYSNGEALIKSTKRDLVY